MVRATLKEDVRRRGLVLNDNQWHTAGEWPLAADDSLFLQSGGRANSSKGDGMLTVLDHADNSAPDIFVCDPEVPVVAPGGLTSAAGPYDQSVIAQGNNILVYTGRPLELPLHVFGSPKVSIHCKTSYRQC